MVNQKQLLSPISTGSFETGESSPLTVTLAVAADASWGTYRVMQHQLL